MNHLEKVGVGNKRELRNKVELHQRHLKTVGGNVGKWEGGSARMWESFESFNLNSTVLSISYSILTERGKVEMWESGKVGARKGGKVLSLLI